MKTRLAVFISGSGTNFKALQQAIDEGSLVAEIVLVVSDNPAAKGLIYAAERGLETLVFPPSKSQSYAAWDEALTNEVLTRRVDLILLAGFLKKVGPKLLKAYPRRILNIHPSLLPKYGGKGCYGLRPHALALEHRDQVAGATVHFVNEAYDEGDIILQRAIEILPQDTAETLQKRVLEHVEWKLYPEAVNYVIKERSMRRALLSVSDKTGLQDFAEGLQALGYELYSTGGTARALKSFGLSVIEVSDYTGFPEILGGRVKTLHPKIFAGILARRERPSDQEEMAALELDYFDLVAVNLYPFKETLQREAPFQEQIEEIDIGGPSLLRAAAKNHSDILVVTDQKDYDKVLEALRNNAVDTELKRALAAKVFRLTAAYDSLIADYLSEHLTKGEGLPTSDLLTKAWRLKAPLRYGENPQQQAWVYEEERPREDSLLQATQIQGKVLSYNNYQDAEAAVFGIRQYQEPTVLALKHMNPCGIASALTIDEAFDQAYAADPVSIFGGIVAQNREVTKAEALKMSEIFLEIILAPSFSQGALDVLAEKKNLRLLALPALAKPLQAGLKEWRYLSGGLLVQEGDNQPLADEPIRVVTKAQPSEKELKDYRFAMQAARLLKSNAIAVTKGLQTLGMGPGQSNRVGAAKIALEMAGEKAKGAILASDAFFPFADTVELAAAYGIKGIIQPGGSVRDQESIACCDEHGLVMLFTGIRHFRH